MLLSALGVLVVVYFITIKHRAHKVFTRSTQRETDAMEDKVICLLSAA